MQGRSEVEVEVRQADKARQILRGKWKGRGRIGGPHQTRKPGDATTSRMLAGLARTQQEQNKQCSIRKPNQASKCHN